jgi:heme/copper-type cytochrome/quinol oxidase subunit 4
LGNEAIEGSKMGSQLIMFVAIVGLALIAFLVGKNLMNTGKRSAM